VAPVIYLLPLRKKVKISMSGIVIKTKQDKDKQEKLQKTFSIEDHLKKSDEKTKKLFYKLREKIVALDENIREEPKKQYIAYKVSTNFADVILYRSEIRITLNVKTGQLIDPQNITTDFTKPKKGHWGNGDYEVKLEDDKELDAVFELVKQSYDLNK
jgi:predicted transport protein